MSIDVNHLPDDPALLKKLRAEHAEKLAQATARNLYLEEQFRLAQQKQFGKVPKALTHRVNCLMKSKTSLSNLMSMLRKRLATLAKHQSANHCQKTYPVSK